MAAETLRSLSTSFREGLPSPRRRQWHPTPVLLPGKSHGWRSLLDCSPWACEESGMTERLHFHFSLFCIGEENGNPLQCSCLENPRDGVAQSRARLKWLSSTSSQWPRCKWDDSFICCTCLVAVGPSFHLQSTGRHQSLCVISRLRIIVQNLIEMEG